MFARTGFNTAEMMDALVKQIVGSGDEGMPVSVKPVVQPIATAI